MSENEALIAGGSRRRLCGHVADRALGTGRLGLGFAGALLAGQNRGHHAGSGTEEQILRAARPGRCR
ncbi:hypothetical protein NDU88_008275 [Pleurodeles waltl]|uniref:Uncharacterized protein n=1 Tax=Pleurodeles waltl TaxID=8319 RepID=A0AAV7NYS8_PLEWA|nr:hypothetical protein NDU88_008275 [Pleurodeles waltl]